MGQHEIDTVRGQKGQTVTSRVEGVTTCFETFLCRNSEDEATRMTQSNVFHAAAELLF